MVLNMIRSVDGGIWLGRLNSLQVQVFASDAKGLALSPKLRSLVLGPKNGPKQFGERAE